MRGFSKNGTARRCPAAVWTRALASVAILSAAIAAAAEPQTREEKVRGDRTKVEAAGFWIYNDLPKGFAEAKAAGKPLVVVLRCIPCEECVKLDDHLFEADAGLTALLERFVRVRIVSTNGLDLGLFQYDTDQSFAVFLLNADGTIYGRFGTRSHRTSWSDDVSVEGLSKALAGALELHADYPAVKASLAGKRGPAPEFGTPEAFPLLRDRYTNVLDFKGKVVQSCIHCHQIGDAQRDLVFRRKEKISDELLFPYPHPKALGLILDPRETAVAARVEAGSLAEKAGLQAGDRLKSLSGRPLLSIADVQWELHHAPADGAELPLTVVRGDRTLETKLSLPAGWRKADDISWRASTWGLRRKALGGMFLVPLPADEREKLHIPPQATALFAQHVGTFAPHNVAQRAGLRKGDVVTAFDGRRDFAREADVIAHALQQKKGGDVVEIELLRDGKRQTVTMKLPE